MFVDGALAALGLIAFAAWVFPNDMEAAKDAMRDENGDRAWH